MGANDVSRVEGRTSAQIAGERIARLNEALAARGRARPAMGPYLGRRGDDRPVLQAAGARLGQGGQGDVDARLATPETSPLFAAGQMAGAPAALVSTATGLATMAKEVKDGRPENLIPAAISLYPGLKMNRLMFAGRSAPSTMEFLLYDKANPEAVPRVLEVPYKAGAIGELSPARAGSLDKWASWFTRSPEKLVDLLKDGPEKTELVKYYPGIEDVDFLLGSGMPDRTLGMVRQNPSTGKPAIILSDKYLARGGIETVDGLVTEPLDVVAHEGGAHVPQELADAYWGTTTRDVYNVTHRDLLTTALRKVAGDTTPVKMSPRSAQNIINYDEIEQTVKAKYPEEVRKAFFFEPDTTDKGIMYGMMQDDIAYNAYRKTAGELHAFEIGARSSDPSLRTSPIKELPENALRFRLSDLLTQQDTKGGDTRADANGGDSPGPETAVSESPVSEPAPQAQGGPRIVINPTTFKNKKDALCVAFNEAFRILMEDMSFSPVSEPTDKQREFFSDTAYANDEEQLRRTILARICTFDTSVKDPTDEQLQEAVEFLESVLEAGYPQNEWEQSSVQRIHDVVERAIGAPPAGEPLAEARADIGGGDSGTKEEETLAELGARQGAGPADGGQGPGGEEDPHFTAGGQEMEEGKVYADYAKSTVSGGGGLTDDAGGLLGEFRKKGQNDEPDTGVAPLDPGELRRTFRATAKRKPSL